jgi:hypothetical protein
MRLNRQAAKIAKKIELRMTRIRFEFIRDIRAIRG